jgi:hypothetical protein
MCESFVFSSLALSIFAGAGTTAAGAHLLTYPQHVNRLCFLHLRCLYLQVRVLQQQELIF